MTAPAQSQRGAAVVEFAVIAPLFFFLIFAILEIGLLIGANQQVEVAAREAARYAVGNEDSVNGIARYTDCAEIRDAARRLSGLLDLEDADITIERDNGPGTSATTVCNPTSPLETDYARGDRIIVSVTYDFSFITPFVGDFFGGGVTIDATERRTLFTKP